MSNIELFADDIDGYLIVAITDNGYLIDLYVTKPTINGNWASTYYGKVKKIDTKLNAAFIDLGDGLTGFLPAKHANPFKRDDEENEDISQILQSGQNILVQVKTEGKENSIYENHKLPRVTAKLHIPGGFIVYNPYSNTINCLGNIDAEIFQELEIEVNQKSGWKSYPSKIKYSKENVVFEMSYLQHQWKEFLQKKQDLDDKAGLIETGPIAIFRAFMDYGVTSFSNIHAGNRLIFDIIADWSQKHFPELTNSKRLRLFKPSRPNERLFDIYDLYGELEKIKLPLVELENGSNLIIENTSALTTIDINQGSAADIDETNFKATYEIARQIKLRNLSGIILIDFIGNVPKKSERSRLISTLEKYLDYDVGDSQVHGFTRLGMVEVTRRRKTASFNEKLNIR